MKVINPAKLVWLVLCIGVIFTTAFIIKAQQSVNNQVLKQSFKRAISERLQEKRAAGSLVLITPEELEKMSTSQGSENGADPCDTATPIQIGQNIGQALNSTDCQLDDGSWADFYTFNGTAGQQVRIFMNSSSIDSYLGLANETGTFVVEDDDSGGGWSALITATLPANGVYIILANSALPNQFGGYTLSTSGPEPCTFTVSPTTTEVPATGGTFTYNVSAPAGCHWQAFSQMQGVTTTSSGVGPGTVTYTVTQNGSGNVRQGSVIVTNAPSAGPYTYFTISQPSVACTYSLNPPTADIPATATSGSFQIVTQSGCPWSVMTGAFASVSGSTSGTGTATINYSMPHNNGAARNEPIWINGISSGLIFRINQAGLNCTFSFTPPLFEVARQAAVRTVEVNTQPGCIWSAMTSSTFLSLQNNLGTGSGTVTFNVAALTDTQSRSGALQFWFGSAGSGSVWVDQSKNYSTKQFDFDADGRSDISIYRPTVGEWWYSRSSDAGNRVAQFGNETDIPVPADYTGDGRTDIAFWRPSTGEWFMLRSEDASFYSIPFGTAGDIPTPGDFDGDGKSDQAVFRPSNSTWYIQQSSAGTAFRQFGAEGDKPVVGDYDRDGKDDIAIYRPSLGQWWITRSVYHDTVAATFGTETDTPVQGDYTGDGATDIAIWRPSTGEWLILRSENASFYSVPFGTTGDIPAPGDYDGDGRFDTAVFRPSTGTWYIQQSLRGTLITTYGATGDQPVPSVFVR
jgi:hypothetical protein